MHVWFRVELNIIDFGKTDRSIETRLSLNKKMWKLKWSNFEHLGLVSAFEKFAENQDECKSVTPYNHYFANSILESVEQGCRSPRVLIAK